MDFKTKLFYFLFILIIVLCGYLFWYTQSEGYKCMIDATKYAQGLVRSPNGMPINSLYFNLTTP